MQEDASNSFSKVADDGVTANQQQSAISIGERTLAEIASHDSKNQFMQNQQQQLANNANDFYPHITSIQQESRVKDLDLCCGSFEGSSDEQEQNEIEKKDSLNSKEQSKKQKQIHDFREELGVSKPGFERRQSRQESLQQRKKLQQQLESTTKQVTAEQKWVFPIGWRRNTSAQSNNQSKQGEQKGGEAPLDARFLSNEISTAKYTCLTFVPLNFLHQLSKGPNIYYLIICALQMIPEITITGGNPTNAPPLVFLMIVSMVKDFFEDRRRRKADKEENNRKVGLVEDLTTASQNDSEADLLKSVNHSQKENLLTHPNRQTERELQENLLQESYNFRKIPWHEVKTGDMVKVEKNQFFPADLVILQSSDPNNTCFVETKNLDGETNLKIKTVSKQIFDEFRSVPDIVEKLKGRVICEPPNDQIYQFQGVIELKQESPLISLSHEHFLLRGSSLRNTDWIVGVVVHTGHDTRIMRNSVRSKQKKSELEILITKSIVVIFATQCALCCVAATFVLVWNRINLFDTDGYLDSLTPAQEELTPKEYWQWYRYVKYWLRAFGTWILLFTNMVPISLLVSVEIVKFAQAIFIQWDISIFYEAEDQPAIVQSSNLNEELGQIEYVFSDKTGTLTQNVMDFRKFTAGDQAYGTEKSIKNNPFPNVNFYDEKFSKAFQSQNQGSKEQRDISKMLINLSLNHTAMVNQKLQTISTDDELTQRKKEPPVSLIQQAKEDKAHFLIEQYENFFSNDLTYSASSPDELALLNGARMLGVTYLGKDPQTNTAQIQIAGQKEPQEYQLLNVIEFSSSRKRMTTVYRSPTGEILVFSKGADSVLLPLLANKESLEVAQLASKTVKQLDDFARTGLRTLLVVQRQISEQFYHEWSSEYAQALASMQDRDAMVDKAAEKLEKDFELVGSTAIDDKLQEGVPQTIKMLREAALKLWVLTGDKIETAINIGYSCELLDQSMNQFVIDGEKSLEIYKQICGASNEQNLCLQTRKMAVVVAGHSLFKILNNERLTAHFVELVERASIVLACRVSPKQKAQIVQLVREKHPNSTTLAIGDGANDVNMIAAAHVGVGIAGKEGMQAVRASDYAIGQFRFLIPLLFYHGREAYRRNSYLALYMFYKNILFVMPLFWFGFFSSFSGQTFYESVLYQGYNIFFTACPIMWFAMADEQYSKQRFHQDPYLYWLGQQRESFSLRYFAKIILKGILNALCITLFVMLALNGDQVGSAGHNGSLWVSGQLIYGIVVLSANLNVIQNTSTHTWISIALVLSSIISYFLWFYVESSLTTPVFATVNHIFGHTMWSGRSLLIIILAVWQHSAVDQIQARWFDRKAALKMQEKRKQNDPFGLALVESHLQDSQIGGDLNIQRDSLLEMAQESMVQRTNLKDGKPSSVQGTFNSNQHQLPPSLQQTPRQSQSKMHDETAGSELELLNRYHRAFSSSMRQSDSERQQYLQHAQSHRPSMKNFNDSLGNRTPNLKDRVGGTLGFAFSQDSRPDSLREQFAQPTTPSARQSLMKQGGDRPEDNSGTIIGQQQHQLIISEENGSQEEADDN